MPSEPLHNSEFHKVEIDHDNQLIYSTWLRTVSRSEMEKGGMKLYEALRNTTIERVLADMRVLSALDSDTKEWMATNFYVFLSKTNLKRLARVLPDNVFHRISLESVVTRAEALGITNFEVKNFRALDEALVWLEPENVKLPLAKK